ncbi:MAG: hypothetical protein E7331_04110 [Clostridiales bacterium]|nr:hypothetical protein [Clostridiales bacterium]
MKFTKKLFALVFVLVTLITTVLPVGALAASKTYKGSDSTTYTLTTGKKASTLTLTPSKGKRAQKYVKKSNARKTHLDKWNVYAEYEVTVNGRTYTVTSKKVTIKLPANGTYRISIRCKGVPYYNIRPAYNPFQYRRTGSEYWYKSPSLKVNVNNSAKVK